MRILLCYVALCVACIAPAFARPKKDAVLREDVPRVGILFLTPPPPVSAKLTKAFRKALFAVGAKDHSMVLVGEPEITKYLKKDPRKFLRACGKQMSCLVTVTKQAKCDRLLMGRWVNPDAPQLQYAIIDAKTESVVSKGSINVTSEREATNAARDNFEVIMGSAPQVAPTLPPEITPVADKPVAPPPKKVAALSNPNDAAETQGQDRVSNGIRHNDAWFISSVVLLGVGAGLAGTGGYFAWHGHQLAQSVTPGADGTPQTQAVATLKDANSATSLANILFYAGAGVGAVGAAILTLHELGILPRPATTPTPTTDTPDAGHAFITPLPGGFDVGYSLTF